MILYNISIIIEDSVHLQVLNWLKNTLPKVPYSIQFLKMLESPHEGTTYCLQFIASDEIVLRNFQEDVVSVLQAYIGSSCADKVFLFDSKMQYISFE